MWQYYCNIVYRQQWDLQFIQFALMKLKLTQQIVFKPTVHKSRKYQGNIPYVCSMLLRGSWIEITPGRMLESCPYGGIRHVLHMCELTVCLLLECKHSHTNIHHYLSLHLLEVLLCLKFLLWRNWSGRDAVVRPVWLSKGQILLS